MNETLMKARKWLDANVSYQILLFYHQIVTLDRLINCWSVGEWEIDDNFSDSLCFTQLATRYTAAQIHLSIQASHPECKSKSNLLKIVMVYF